MFRGMMGLMEDNNEMSRTFNGKGLDDAFTDAELAQLWDGLRDIPFSEDMDSDEISEEPYYFFPVNTPKEEIWHWFDARHSKGLVDGLMYKNRLKESVSVVSPRIMDILVEDAFGAGEITPQVPTEFDIASVLLETAVDKELGESGHEYTLPEHSWEHRVNNFLTGGTNSKIISEFLNAHKSEWESGKGDWVESVAGDSLLSEQTRVYDFAYNIVHPLEEAKEDSEKPEDIKVKHPGILDIPAGRHFYEMPEEHYIKLAKDKGKAAVMRALENLHRWNKEKHPGVASKAGKIINALKNSLEWQNLDKEKNESVIVEKSSTDEYQEGFLAGENGEDTKPGISGADSMYLKGYGDGKSSRGIQSNEEYVNSDGESDEAETYLGRWKGTPESADVNAVDPDNMPEQVTEWQQGYLDASLDKEARFPDSPEYMSGYEQKLSRMPNQGDKEAMEGKLYNPAKVPEGQIWDLVEKEIYNL